jgi:hypothetical protein
MISTKPWVRGRREGCSLGKRVGRDHDAVLLTSRSFKPNGASGTLELIARSRKVIVIALESSSQFDISRLGARPVHSRHVGGDVSVGHATFTCSTTGVTSWVGRTVDVDFLVGPVAETDVGTGGGTGCEAGCGDGEHEVHGGVEVEEEDRGGEGISDKSGDEEDDSIFEEELPERGTSRGQEETDGGDDENRQIDKHGWGRVSFVSNKRRRGGAYCRGTRD